MKNAKTVVSPKPRDMGAIEVAMLTAGQRGKKEVFEPVLGMVFDSYEEGYDFYNLYSWEVGFGIIYNHSTTRKNDKDYRTMQEFTCQKGVRCFSNSYSLCSTHTYFSPNVTNVK